MKEKERFEYYPKQNQLYDKTNDELYCLGIEQDKTRLVEFLNLMNEDWLDLYERNKKLRAENQQLKQSQKQLAVEELEKLKERIVLNDEYDEYTGHNIINSFELLEDINARIKELKGEK